MVATSHIRTDRFFSKLGLIALSCFICCIMFSVAAQAQDKGAIRNMYGVKNNANGYGNPGQNEAAFQANSGNNDIVDTSYPGGKRQMEGKKEAEQEISPPVQCGSWPCPTAGSKSSKVPSSLAQSINTTRQMAGTCGPSGCNLASGNVMAIAGMQGAKLAADMLNNPEANIPKAKEALNQQNQCQGDNCAAQAKEQSQCAIEFVRTYLVNFTVNGANKWNILRNQLFIPMAVLLLLPGAVITQVKSTVAQGFPIFGEISPIEGIYRSIVSIFLIPGTYLIVNYGIDVSNSISFTIQSQYFLLFGSDMYRDAECAQIRAFPERPPSSNMNHIPMQAAKMFIPAVPSAMASAFGRWEDRNVAVAIQDPCAGLNLLPKDRTNEQVPYYVNAQRAGINGMNAALTTTWNILCAFQEAYLYYLWFVGPVMAALWVWPMKQLRDAFPNWCEGVITICFWSLFWHTTVLIMACFRGVDETGTLIMTALNFLSSACVKFAFDFAGLVKAAGHEAGKMAEKAMQGSKGGGGGQGGGGGGQQDNQSDGKGDSGVDGGKSDGSSSSRDNSTISPNSPNTDFTTAGIGSDQTSLANFRGGDGNTSRHDSNSMSPGSGSRSGDGTGNGLPPSSVASLTSSNSSGDTTSATAAGNEATRDPLLSSIMTDLNSSITAPPGLNTSNLQLENTHNLSNHFGSSGFTTNNHSSTGGKDGQPSSGDRQSNSYIASLFSSGSPVTNSNSLNFQGTSPTFGSTGIGTSSLGSLFSPDSSVPLPGPDGLIADASLTNVDNSQDISNSNLSAGSVDGNQMPPGVVPFGTASRDSVADGSQTTPYGQPEKNPADAARERELLTQNQQAEAARITEARLAAESQQRQMVQTNSQSNSQIVLDQQRQLQTDSVVNAQNSQRSFSSPDSLPNGVQPTSYPQVQGSNPTNYTDQSSSLTAQTSSSYQYAPVSYDVSNPGVPPAPVPTSNQYTSVPSSTYNTTSSSDSYSQVSAPTPNPYIQTTSSDNSYSQTSAPAQNPYIQPTVSSGDSYSQTSTPAPNPYIQPTVSSGDSYSQTSTPAPNPYIQPTVSSGDSYSQTSAPAPNPYIQPTVSSGDSYSQTSAPAPNPYIQPTVSSGDNYSSSGPVRYVDETSVSQTTRYETGSSNSSYSTDTSHASHVQQNVSNNDFVAPGTNHQYTSSSPQPNYVTPDNSTASYSSASYSSQESAPQTHYSAPSNYAGNTSSSNSYSNSYNAPPPSVYNTVPLPGSTSGPSETVVRRQHHENQEVVKQTPPDGKNAKQSPASSLRQKFISGITGVPSPLKPPSSSGSPPMGNRGQRAPQNMARTSPSAPPTSKETQGKANESLNDVVARRSTANRYSRSSVDRPEEMTEEELELMKKLGNKNDEQIT